MNHDAWMHLDMAGVMSNKSEVPFLPKGMAGKYYNILSRRLFSTNIFLSTVLRLYHSGHDQIQFWIITVLIVSGSTWLSSRNEWSPEARGADTDESLT